MLRIVNAVMIDNQSIDDLAKLQKPVPVMAVPCQPGCFDGKNSAGFPLTDLGEKCLESPPLNASAA